MSEKKKWKGIQINWCIFQGEVVDNPVFNGEYVFLTLRTVVLKRDANGQVVEMPQDIPLMVEPDGPTSVAKNHIMAGRKIAAWGYYMSWNDGNGNNQHAIVVKKFDLGDKPYDPQQYGNTPPIPNN